MNGNELKYKSIGLIIQNENKPSEILLTKRGKINPEFGTKESYPGIFQKTIVGTIEKGEKPSGNLKKEIFEEVEEVLGGSNISDKNKKTIINYINKQENFGDKLYKENKHLTITHKIPEKIFNILEELDFFSEDNPSLKKIDLNKKNLNLKPVDKTLREKGVKNDEIFLFPDDIKILKQIKNE